MRRMWRAWVAWAAETESPVVLAMFRILVGSTVLIDVGGMLWTPHVVEVFVGIEHGGLAPDGRGGQLVQALGGVTPGLVSALLLGICGVASAVTAGAGGRLSPLVLGQLLVLLYSLSPGSGGGHDRLITNAAWLLVLGRSTATWSLDAWWRTGRWHDPTPIPSLARRLAFFQLALMYTITGLAKQGTAWTSAEGFRAVYDALLLPSWSVHVLTWLGAVYPVVQLATVVAWWWEATFFVVLVQRAWVWYRAPRWPWWADLRWVYLPMGVVLHGVLWVTSDLGPFPLITLAYYPCLLAPRVSGSREERLS